MAATVTMTMVIMATIMLVITLMIVTGSAKAVSVRSPERLGQRTGALCTLWPCLGLRCVR